MESERDFYKSKYSPSDGDTTQNNDEIASMRQLIRDVRIERDKWQSKFREMEAFVEKKRYDRVSRKKSKVTIEFEILQNRLEQSEKSRQKLQLQCKKLEAENKMLRLENVTRLAEEDIPRTKIKKKKKKKKKKIDVTQTPPPPIYGRNHVVHTKKKNLSPTIHERLKKANKTRTIPFIPAGNAQASRNLIGRVQTKLAEDRYRDPRQCNASHAEDVKIASLSVLRRLRDIV